MSETEQTEGYRADIARRNRRRTLDERASKFSMAVFGLMGYSAFANFLGGALAFGSSPTVAVFGVSMGALCSLGVYRVWVMDDTRWWPVAVPAGISIAFLALLWVGGMPRPIPLVLNAALLALVPLRKRAVAAAVAAAVPNNSFKPKPLRGSA